HGKTQDQSSALQDHPLPTGSLRRADLGYYHFLRWGSLGQKGYWLTRLPCSSLIFDAGVSRWQRVEWLKKLPANSSSIEMEVDYSHPAKVQCRLLAVRVPSEVAAERRRKIRAHAKRKGRTPSLHPLEMADWTVLATHVPPALLSLTKRLSWHGCGGRLNC
ncbi:hypothetical protein HYR99_41915, partial [Candidatus Poribacteria bacterium]|nr:hypothetical protein [Candidatus Poribacteria bacterium]